MNNYLGLHFSCHVAIYFIDTMPSLRHARKKLLQLLSHYHPTRHQRWWGWWQLMSIIDIYLSRVYLRLDEDGYYISRCILAAQIHAIWNSSCFELSLPNVKCKISIGAFQHRAICIANIAPVSHYRCHSIAIKMVYSAPFARRVWWHWRPAAGGTASARDDIEMIDDGGRYFECFRRRHLLYHLMTTNICRFHYLLVTLACLLPHLLRFKSTLST